MTTKQLNPKFLEDIQAAASVASLPDIEWVHGDDLCDCTFQQIGEWTNPYIAKTLRVRLCCIWAEVFKQFPQHVQEIDAFYDYNKGVFATALMSWNGEQDMPRAMWHRQLASKTGLSLAEVREKYGDKAPPKGKPKRKAARV